MQRLGILFFITFNLFFAANDIQTSTSEAPKGSWLTGSWKGYTEQTVGRQNMENLQSLSNQLANINGSHDQIKNQRRQFIIDCIVNCFLKRDRSHSINLNSSTIWITKNGESLGGWDTVGWGIQEPIILTNQLSNAYTPPSKAVSYGIPTTAAGVVGGITYFGMRNLVGDSLIGRISSILLSGGLTYFGYKQSFDFLKEKRVKFVDKNFQTELEVLKSNFKN